MDTAFFLAASGLLAGAMNALAGGGSFVTLPALIAAGVPSVSANASSTLALYPGGLASAWVYRAGLGTVCGVPLRPALAVTLAGGLVGAILLLVTSNTLFDRVLPWLLLAATIMLALGPRLGPVLHRHLRASLPAVLAIQFALGLYGGYFGGAVGLMMMAAWSLMKIGDLKTLAAPRTLMVTAANTAAVLSFAIAGAIRWPEALLVGVGAALGGWAGAHLGRRLPAALVRAATIMVAAGMTAAFFARAYA